MPVGQCPDVPDPPDNGASMVEELGTEEEGVLGPHLASEDVLMEPVDEVRNILLDFRFSISAICLSRLLITITLTNVTLKK